MKQKEYQSGSIHLVLILLLVIAVLGTLGFIFWRNIKNSEPKQIISKTITLRLSNRNSILFTYPSNWVVGLVDNSTVTDDTVEISQSNPVHITSPSKDINVVFWTFDYYVTNQSCSDSYRQPEYFYSVYESTPIKNLSGAYYVQGFVNGDNGVISDFDARLQKKPNYSDVEMLQKSNCEAQANSRISYELDDGRLGTFQASIELTADIDGPGSTADMYSHDYVIKKFASDEFKSAKEILLSAKSID